MLKKLVLLGLLCLGCSEVYAKEYYTWGFGVDGKFNKYVQVNGDVDYKIEQAKDFYVFLGLGNDKILNAGVGYYLWYGRLGVQVGYNTDSEVVGSLFLSKNVLQYLGNILIKAGE